MNLPVLRIVSVASLVVHETVDPARVARLKKQFRSSKLFTNPPLVAELGRGRYVVLDGANRTTVAQQLHLPHVLVQVVPYDDRSITLNIWNHVLDGTAWLQWWKQVHTACGDSILSSTPASARRRLARGTFLAIVFNARGECFGMTSPVGEQERAALLNVLVETYKGRDVFHRTDEQTMPAVRAIYPVATALICFPPLKKGDILRYAGNGWRIPSGISRHVIPGRVLRADIPFSVLRSTETLVQKNRWLQRLIRERKKENRIRYYREPVYLYAE